MMKYQSILLKPFNLMNSDTKLQAEQRMKNTNEHILEHTKGFQVVNNFSLYPQMSLFQMRSNAFFKGAENWKKCAQLSLAPTLQAHRCSISFALQNRPMERHAVS